MRHLFDFLRTKAAPLASSPARSVVVPVATPAISLQLGWAKVAGLWGETQPVAASWIARRTARVRWRPLTPVARQVWRDAGRPKA